jgi:archaellum biogenesis ATPase FlaH
MICIWVEGTDNTGKTTLCKRLAEEFGLVYTHCSKPSTDNPFEEYADLINSIRDNSVFDRGFLGEYVYSQLWRGGCSISLKQFQELELMCQLKFREVILIHATAPLEVIRERCIDQKEELLKLDQIERCSELFQEIVDNSTLDKILYDSSVETPEDVISKIKQIINK